MGARERLHHQEIMLQGCRLPELKRLTRSEQTQKHRGIVMTSKQVISNADFPPVCRAPYDKIYHLLLICFKAIKMELMFSSILSLFNAPVSQVVTGVSPAKIHTKQVPQWSNCPHTLHRSAKGFPFPISSGWTMVSGISTEFGICLSFFLYIYQRPILLYMCEPRILWLKCKRNKTYYI